MCRRRSHTRWLKPYSLSYQDTSLTKCSFRAMQALASKMEERTSLLKSVDTTWSSVYSRNPFIGPLAASFTLALISSILAGFSRRTVRSTPETSGVGTRKAIPVSLPLSAGMTLPTALAAPVEAGMMFWAAPRPSLHNFPDGPSTVFCVAVVAWTVVMSPSTISKLSWITFARGARQLVVQEPMETTFSDVWYEVWFTPITYIGASAEGAEMITFLAPPFMWSEAFSMVVNTPVLSTTYSAPASDHLMLAGSLSLKTVTALPLMTSFPSLASTVPFQRPWVESYLNM